MTIKGKTGLLVMLMAVLLPITSAAQNVAIWTDVAGINYDPLTGALTKTGTTNTWGQAGARSINKLDASTDGSMSYTVEDITTHKFIGLAHLNESDQYIDSDFGVFFNKKHIMIIESGSMKGSFGKIKVGDVIKIERFGSDIKYYKNGTVLRTVPTNSALELYADVCIKTSGASVSGITCSFDPVLTILPTITHETTTLNGKVVLDATGGVAGYKYALDGGIMTQTEFDQHKSDLLLFFDSKGVSYDTTTLTYANYLSGFDQTLFDPLEPDVYPAEVRDAGGAETTKLIVVGTDVETEFVNGINITTDAWEMDASANDFTDSELITSNVMGSKETGGLEVEISKHDEAIVGFKKAEDQLTGRGIADIEAGFYFDNGKIHTIEKGVVTENPAQEISTEKVGFIIQKHLDKLELFKRDDQLEKRSFLIDRQALKLKVAFSKGSGVGGGLPKIGGPAIAFAKPKVLTTFDVVHASCEDLLANSITANNTVVGPYVITSEVWQDEQGVQVGTGSVLSNVPAGVYTYIVTATGPAGNVSYTHNVRVGIKASWTDVVNLTVGSPPDEDQLSGTTAGQGSAITENILKADETGFAAFLPNDVSTTQNDYLISINFVDVNATTTVLNGAFLIDNAVGGSGKKLRLFILENGVLVTPVAGIIVRDERHIDFAYDGAGNLAISYQEFPSTVQTTVINLPAAAEYAVVAELDDSPNSFIEEAIVSWSCPGVKYSLLKKELDAEVVEVEQDQLRFYYEERYTRNSGDLLEYNIYAENRSLVASVDGSGTAVPSISPTQGVTYGFNPVDLDLGPLALSPGVYTLEVISPKDDKQYLKFKVQ